MVATRPPNIYADKKGPYLGSSSKAAPVLKQTLYTAAKILHPFMAPSYSCTMQTSSTKLVARHFQTQIKNKEIVEYIKKKT